MISIPRFCAAACVASLILLSGCENASDKTIVAWINGEKIASDEYNERVQSVTSIPDGVNTDAGGLTMINVIRDKLTEQLARKSKSVPSDDVVSQEADFRVRSDTRLANSIASGKTTQIELMREVKFEIEAVGIGTNGDHPKEEVLRNDYDDIVAGKKPEWKSFVFESAQYTLKSMPVPDPATGAQLIAGLKKTGSFKTAIASIPSLATMNASEPDKEQFANEDQAPPELKAALESLKPNEISPTPVVIRIPNPTQPMNPQIYYLVVQLIHKDNATTLPFNKVRFHLEQEVLKQTHPDWVDHYRRELGNFTNTSQIRIAIKRYEGLMDAYVRPKAASVTGTAPSMAPTVPQ